MCLCLIDDDDGGDINQLITSNSGITCSSKDVPKGQLIGHVKVSQGSLEGEAYIESLIICKSRRGQGLGSQFMVSIEQLLKSLGFTSVTLHTIDASAFYAKLGYILVTTIEALGPASVTNINTNITKVSPKINTNRLIVSKDGQGTSSTNCPLPPPLPQSISTNRPVIKQEKIVMNKRLS